MKTELEQHSQVNSRYWVVVVVSRLSVEVLCYLLRFRFPRQPSQDNLQPVQNRHQLHPYFDVRRAYYKWHLRFSLQGPSCTKPLLHEDCLLHVPLSDGRALICLEQVERFFIETLFHSDGALCSVKASISTSGFGLNAIHTNIWIMLMKHWRLIEEAFNNLLQV